MLTLSPERHSAQMSKKLQMTA